MSKELYENLEMQNEYRSHFGHTCEVWQHLPEFAKAKCTKLGRRPWGKKDVHHIFHNIGRIDEWSNLIFVNHVVHINWGHGFNLKELTIVSVYSKWWKSQQEVSRSNPYPSDEFNLDEMRYCLGRCVKQWLEDQLYEERLHDEYKRMCMEIRESF